MFFNSLLRSLAAHGLLLNPFMEKPSRVSIVAAVNSILVGALLIAPLIIGDVAFAQSDRRQRQEEERQATIAESAAARMASNLDGAREKAAEIFQKELTEYMLTTGAEELNKAIANWKLENAAKAQAEKGGEQEYYLRRYSEYKAYTLLLRYMPKAYENANKKIDALGIGAQLTAAAHDELNPFRSRTTRARVAMSWRSEWVSYLPNIINDRLQEEKNREEARKLIATIPLVTSPDDKPVDPSKAKSSEFNYSEVRIEGATVEQRREDMPSRLRRYRAATILKAQELPGIAKRATLAFPGAVAKGTATSAVAVAGFTKHFTAQSTLFNIPLGFIMIAQLGFDYSRDPLALEHFIESLKDPAVHAGFAAFIATNHEVSRLLMGVMEGRIGAHLLPYIGMSAGMTASNIVHELWADREVWKCVGSHFKEIEACDKAYESWVTMGKIDQFAPGIISLCGSTVLAGLVQKIGSVVTTKTTRAAKIAVMAFRGMDVAYDAARASRVAMGPTAQGLVVNLVFLGVDTVISPYILPWAQRLLMTDVPIGDVIWRTSPLKITVGDKSIRLPSFGDMINAGRVIAGFDIVTPKQEQLRTLPEAREFMNKSVERAESEGWVQHDPQQCMADYTTTGRVFTSNGASNKEFAEVLTQLELLKKAMPELASLFENFSVVYTSKRANLELSRPDFLAFRDLVAGYITVIDDYSVAMERAKTSQDSEKEQKRLALEFSEEIRNRITTFLADDMSGKHLGSKQKMNARLQARSRLGNSEEIRTCMMTDDVSKSVAQYASVNTKWRQTLLSEFMTAQSSWSEALTRFATIYDATYDLYSYVIDGLNKKANGQNVDLSRNALKNVLRNSVEVPETYHRDEAQKEAFGGLHPSQIGAARTPELVDYMIASMVCNRPAEDTPNMGDKAASLRWISKVKSWKPEFLSKSFLTSWIPGTPEFTGFKDTVPAPLTPVILTLPGRSPKFVPPGIIRPLFDNVCDNGIQTDGPEYDSEGKQLAPRLTMHNHKWMAKNSQAAGDYKIYLGLLPIALDYAREDLVNPTGKKSNFEDWFSKRIDPAIDIAWKTYEAEYKDHVNRKLFPALTSRDTRAMSFCWGHETKVSDETYAPRDVISCGVYHSMELELRQYLGILKTIYAGFDEKKDERERDSSARFINASKKIVDAFRASTNLSQAEQSFDIDSINGPVTDMALLMDGYFSSGNGNEYQMQTVGTILKQISALLDERKQYKAALEIFDLSKTDTTKGIMKSKGNDIRTRGGG